MQHDGFGVVPGYSDSQIVRNSVGVSIAITLANIGVELGWKLTYHQNLTPATHTSLYMGMQVALTLEPNQTLKQLVQNYTDIIILKFLVVEGTLVNPNIARIANTFQCHS